MRIFHFPRFADKAVVVTCLLALTSFLPGSWQAGAQTTAAAPANERAISSEGIVPLSNHLPHEVADGTAMRLDHYSPEKKLRLAIFVTPPDLAGEEKFLQELQTKGSPNFHKFLTAEEWNARFGPKVEDEQQVVDWAKSQGLTVTNRYANRLLVDVEAPSGVIEQALGVTINHYKVGEEVDFSNDRDPSIPAHLSGIVGGIFGLNSIVRMKPVSGHAESRKGWDYVPGPVHSEGVNSQGDGDPSKAPWNKTAEAASVKSGAASAKSAAVSASGLTTPNPPDEIGGVDPANLYSSQVYDYSALLAQSKCCNVHNDSNGSPADTSIALATFGGFNESDANTFFQFYGMAWNITAYSINGYIDGENSIPGTECIIGVDAGCNSDGGDDEADLDVEYSTAFSNSFGSSNDTAHVYVYEGANGYQGTYFDMWNSILNDGHAHVVSTSYGGEETSYWSGYVSGTAVGDAHYIFNQMVGEGLTLVAAAGDQGSTPGCGDGNGVIYPSSDPDFVAAGGTALKLNYDGTWLSENAWTGGTTLKDCQTNGGGGGGGLSVMFSAPSWQSGINYEEWTGGNQYIVSGNTQRKVPDISLEAGGYGQWDYCTTTGCQNDGVDGWGTWGGTSIVAPELAGFFAQENSYLNSIGHICGSSGTDACEPIGNPAPILYYEGEGQGAAHYPFYDITQDCVTNYLTATYPTLLYFCAEPGYDLATGWGSANMLQLAWAFNFYIIPSDGVPAVSFSGPATHTWYNSDQVVSWTVSDGVTASTAGLPAPGVAGFTQGWDSIPADVYTEPNGGSGNSFYSGPQYPYGKTGCLAFNGADGCSGNPGQGCHTVNVGAWDNQGFYTGAKTYGPICYDTVAPTISVSTNPATSGTVWVNKAVTVTLTATDPGGTNASGIYRTYYAINSASCYPGSTSACSVYSGPFTIATQGQTYIYYWTQDKAGNVSAETYQWVSIDTSTPVTTAILSGTVYSGSTYESVVGVTLNASETGGSGIAAIYYTLDGGAETTYGGPFNVSVLGTHTLKYWSVTSAGTSSSTQTLTFTVDSPTTATVVASPNPSVNGQSVTMTATVTATVSGTPTGTVTFWNGATNLGTGTLSGGVATLRTATLPVGALTLQISYPGAGNFLATNSPPFDQTVHETTSTAVTSSLNPAAYGSTVTLSATVKPSISGTPTGTVSFYHGATLLGTATLNSSSVGSLAVNTLPVGSNSITAVYSGDSTYTTSTSTALDETISKASSATAIATSISSSSYDQPVTFTATVTSAGGTPTGSVMFYASGKSLGSGTLVNGVATLTTSTLALGAYTITASYSGSADFSTSTSSGTSLVVVAESTTTALTSSLNPSNYGELVTFTATVKSALDGVPTGIVSFLSNGTSIGTGTLSNGVATFATYKLPLGTNSITAVYAGSTDYTASTSVAVSEVEDIQPTTTTLTSSLSPSSYSQAVTFTATVSSASVVKPTGTVTFLANGTSIGTGSLSNGVATLKTSTLAAGTHSITANYAGTTDYGTSTSDAVSQVVNADATTTTLTSSLTPSGYGQTVTFTATVNDSTTSTTGTPAGTVTFLSNGTSIGSKTLSNGVATLATDALPLGADSITVVYGGSTDYTASTSAAVSQVVSVEPTTTALVSSLNPASYDADVTFTATVSSVAAIKPTGTVTFYSNGTSIGTGTLSNGVATLITRSLPVGANSITATYAGNADYTTSTSAAVSQVIDADATTTTLTSSVNPSAFDQAINFTATVKAANGTPSGTVTFYANGTSIGTVSLSSGVAGFKISSLPVGANSITATYAGNADYTTSTSAAVSQVTNAAATTTKVTSSLNPSTVGASVTFTATVTPATGGTVSGTVTFMDGTTSLGTGTLSSGKATLAATTLPSGTNSITVVYAGSIDYLSSTSTALTQTVNTAAAVVSK